MNIQSDILCEQKWKQSVKSHENVKKISKNAKDLSKVYWRNMKPMLH